MKNNLLKIIIYLAVIILICVILLGIYPINSNKLLLGSLPVLSLPQGGTGVSTFNTNSIIVSGSTATSSLLATSSNPLYVGSIYATSTTATSTFAGGLNVAGTSGLTVLQNGNVGIGKVNPTAKLDVNGTLAVSGIANFIGTYLSASKILSNTFGPNGDSDFSFVDFNSVANVTFAYKTSNSLKGVGIGTTTPQWPLTIASSTASQLSLSAGAGIPQWTFRNAGGNLYISTTTVAGTATTSIWALKIDGTTGMTSFHQPSAELSSGVSQVCTNINTAYPLTFDYNDNINDGLTHSTTVNNATTTINYAGTYEIIFSTIASTDAGTGHMGIWLNVNNTNVASSSTYVELPDIAETVITAPIIYSFSANDQFQLRMACDNAGSFTVSTASGGLGGVMPASPSTIMTIKRISQ